MNFLKNRVMEGENQGGGTTPPPAATTTPTPVGTPPPASDPPFFSGWKNEEVKGWAQAKSYKDSETLALSALNAERLITQLKGKPDSLVAIPEKPDDAEGWNKFYERLGRPATPKEYKLPAPKDADPQFLEIASGMFHEAGLSQSQAEKVTAKWNDYVANAQKAQLEARSNQNVQEETSLKKEWGKAFDDNIALAKRGAKTFGLDAPTIDKLESALGFAGLMKFMHNVGSKLGEGEFVGGSHDGFKALTPQNAVARIEYLKQDSEFMKKYISGDQQAIAQMRELFECVQAGN